MYALLSASSRKRPFFAFALAFLSFGLTPLCGKPRPRTDLHVQIAEVHWQGTNGGVQGYGHGNVYQGQAGRGFDFAFYCGEAFGATNGNAYYPAYWKKEDQRLIIETTDISNQRKLHYCELKTMTRDYLYAPNYTALKTVPVGAPSVSLTAGTPGSQQQRPAISLQEQQRRSSCLTTHTAPLAESALAGYRNDFVGDFSAVKMSGILTTPELLSKIEPTYSPEACIEKISGSVKLRLTVDTQGFARNIQVVTGLGYGLDEKAIEAVHQWRFRSATKHVTLDGKQVDITVPCAANVEVVFHLL